MVTREKFTPTAVEGSKLFITIAAMLSSLMAVLDISIVNVALNDIRASFGVQMDQIAWVSTGYMMANIVVIPMTGWFQRRFGLKNYFLFSLCIFTISSLLCALSWNLISLVFFRILQGMGGGAIIPTASTIMLSRYPKEEQGMAQAFIGLGAITGPLLGPTVGGYLIDFSSWHLIFLINLPIGLLCLFVAMMSIKVPNFIPSQQQLDRYGFLLLAVGLSCLQYVLEEGNRDDWFESHIITFLSIISLTCLVTLIFQQLESKEPMIDFRVFINRNYALCTFINFILGTTLFGGSFLFSLYCGNVMNYAPLDIGLLFLKGTCIQIIMMPLVGKLVNVIDKRILIAFGVIVVFFSLWKNSHLTANSSEGALIFVLFLRALGLGCLFIPLSITAIAFVKPKELGNALGLFNLTRELGGSIGLAWMSSQLVNHVKEYNVTLGSHIVNGLPVVDQQLRLMQFLFYGKTEHPQQAAYQLMQNRINLQATVESFNKGFLILSLVFLTSLILLILIEKPKKGATPVEGMH
ncbi:DHA2 family efflux MFS transporter permease subunit [Silvanigrella aquatica]|uniref:MFS transporter n=1 Tax=Silvanigrella aquatica TaxID=1915309 RepID=A0A1L4CZX8_9BACT|nr:DHA2 family efflux MFS transporter permease subunit [Silvanigrella aquatica]APJ03512.1 MFS transporter [Silvanigrella aquatica]